MSKKKKVKFEGKIEPLIDCKPFYMVVIEDGVYPPKIKYEKYEEVFNECLRLSKKENKKAYILISVTQIEQIPNVKQFNNEL